MSAAKPGLDGSQVAHESNLLLMKMLIMTDGNTYAPQVQAKIWKKWVRGETPKSVLRFLILTLKAPFDPNCRPRVKEEPTRRSVEVRELDGNCLADFFRRGVSPPA